MSRTTASQAADPRWIDLYRLGGIGYIMVAALVLFAVAAYFIWPYAGGGHTAADIFAALQSDTLGTLFSLDVLMIVIAVINIVPTLALYVAIKPVNESYALIALVIALVALAILVPTRPLAELVSLSGQYAEATTEAARNHYLAAGEALLAHVEGTGWMVQNLLLCLSALINSVLMLRSRVFSKTTAWVGIATGILGLGFLIPVVGALMLLLNTILSIVWCVLIALALFRLGWSRAGPAPATA